ncbi:MAG: response regulator [Acidobacteriota bacterium]
MSDSEARPKLLIVDDDRDYCGLLSAWLSDRFDVEVAHDGEAGLERAEKLEPLVVLLDVMMPKLSGLSLAWVFKHNPKFLRAVVIFLTGAEVDARVLAKADGMLAKPFTRVELNTLIAETLTKRKLDAGQIPPIYVDEMSHGMRRAPRVKVEIPATFELPGAVIPGKLLSLSPWGAFFATDQALPIHKTGRVRFAAGSSELDLESYPIYQSRHEGASGVGLRLRSTHLEMEHRLHQLIETQLPRRGEAE